MLKSPSSILNSIKKMKCNLRNDKQQLRIIKNNFVYLEQPSQCTKQLSKCEYVKSSKQSSQIHNKESLNQVLEQSVQYTNRDNKNNRSKSLFNIDYLKEKALQNKENYNDSNNLSRVSQISNKTKHNNKLYIDDQADNILKELSGFRRNQHSRAIVSRDDKLTVRQDKPRLREDKLKAKEDQNNLMMSNEENDNRKQLLNIKTMKNRYLTQIEKLKQSHEEQKSQLIIQMNSKLQNQSIEYENQLNQLKDYITLLEEQLQKQQSTPKHSYSCIREVSFKNECEEYYQQVDKVNSSVQITQKIQQSLQVIDQQVQTDVISFIDRQQLHQLQQQQLKREELSEIPQSYQSNTSSQYISKLQFVSNTSNIHNHQSTSNTNYLVDAQYNQHTQSQIQSQTSPNEPISKINDYNIYHNELIEQICRQFQQSNPSSSHSSYSSERQFNTNNTYQRQRYEHIINRLLEENTKMHKKIQKIYASHHHQTSKLENSKDKSSKDKSCFFKNYGINYKTVTSNHAQDSNYNSFSNEHSKVINRYFSSNQNLFMQNLNQNPSQSNQSQSVSEFTARVTDSNNDNYLSNRQSSNEIKNKGSIVYRISNVLSTERCKDGKNSSRSKIPCKHPPVQIKPFSTQNQRQHHVRMKTQICQRPTYNDDFSSNDLTSSYKERRNQPIQMRDNPKMDKQFKFYDSQSMKSSIQQRQSKPKTNINWQEESESEILNDEMKLKTIKTFKCFSKE